MSDGRISISKKRTVSKFGNRQKVIPFSLNEHAVFYKHLTEHTPVAIVIHRKGKIVFANPAAAKLVAIKSPSELIGRAIMDFVHPDNKEMVLKRVKMMMEKKKVAPAVEEKFINAQGAIIYAEVKAVPFDFEGEPSILTILHDITERITLEMQLKQSEERFRSLIEHSNDVITLMNKTGKIIYSTHSVTRVLGYPLKKFIGSNAFSYVYPIDIALVSKKLAKLLLRSGNTETIEIRVKKNNGEVIWVEVVGTNLLSDPSVRAVVTNYRDISDRKRTQTRNDFMKKAADILMSSLDYEMTIKNIANLVVPKLADYCRIVILDETGKQKEVAVNHIDPKKVKLVKNLYLKYQKDTNATYGIPKILATGKSECITHVDETYLEPIKANKALVKLVKEISLKSYMGVPLLVRGKVIGAMTFSSIQEGRFYSESDLSFAQELANRVALALENSRLFLNEQRAVTVRDDFISLASHELNTPVTSLKMFAQGLAKHYAKAGDTKLITYLGKMEQQIDKLTVLIKDLLNVSRLRHGRLEFTMSKFSLDNVVHDITESIQTTTTKHTLNIHGSVQKLVWGDKDRIGQVLTNLLTNAIKYSPDKTAIEIRLSKEKKFAKVTVKDFGIGIDASHHAKIFDQFYRVDSPTEKTYPGLGLGLFISHEIIDKHGGELTVTSEKGKGSQFTFTIPYNKLRIKNFIFSLRTFPIEMKYDGDHSIHTEQ